MQSRQTAARSRPASPVPACQVSAYHERTWSWLIRAPHKWEPFGDHSDSDRRTISELQRNPSHISAAAQIAHLLLQYDCILGATWTFQCEFCYRRTTKLAEVRRRKIVLCPVRPAACLLGRASVFNEGLKASRRPALRARPRRTTFLCSRRWGGHERYVPLCRIFFSESWTTEFVQCRY